MQLEAAGSRPLIFSQWTAVLDIMEWMMEVLQLRYVRLDGSTGGLLRGWVRGCGAAGVGCGAAGRQLRHTSPPPPVPAHQSHPPSHHCTPIQHRTIVRPHPTTPRHRSRG